MRVLRLLLRQEAVEWAIRTSVAKAVFPPPLGPTSRKVGRVVPTAACRYRKECNSIGKTNATTRVTRMVVRLGEKAAVSQLSWSYHAMVGSADRIANYLLRLTYCDVEFQGGDDALENFLAMT